MLANDYVIKPNIYPPEIATIMSPRKEFLNGDTPSAAPIPTAIKVFVTIRIMN